MNNCHDRHDPMYKIKYKPTQVGGLMSEWLVCEKCFGRQEFFGESEDIESIVSLRDCTDINLEIDHLYIMTRTVTKKLKKNLLVK